DARVVKMEITWGRDGHFETEVSPEDIANFKSVIIPEIEEGIYTFDIRTLDREGNQSMRAEIFGRVYGDSYIANLNNRIIDNVREVGENLVINWFPESADSTLLGTVVSYQTTGGRSEQVFTVTTMNQTILPQFEKGTEFTF